MFNFRNGTALASQQDQYVQIYRNGGKLSSGQISDMEQNVWVATAAKTAPGNLVIRQWALIDLFKGYAAHKDSLLAHIDLLSYKQIGDYRVWAEGYSYFKYSMDVIDLWISKFQGSYDLTTIKSIIAKIKQGFITTAYLRNGVWYPAPFGDLWNEPLADDLQINHDLKTVRVTNVIMNYLETEKRTWYSITGRPIGLNTHIPKDDSTVTIVNGSPSNFKFYQGYDKKYKSAWDEYLDTYNIKRIRSIPF